MQNGDARFMVRRVMRRLGAALCGMALFVNAVGEVAPAGHLDRIDPPRETLDTPQHFKRHLPTPWPLTFKTHNFGAHCYNTLRCSVVYANYNFTRPNADHPSGPPPFTDYRTKWKNASYLGIENFPSPAELTWTSVDGTTHKALVDIGSIFKDERVIHHVERNNIPEGWGHNIVPSIYVEINDKTVYVLMRAHIATKDFRDPQNPDSNYRRDTILAWSHSY